MSKLRALILLPFFCSSLPVTANAQAQTTLQQGTPIERALGPGQTHEFTVTLQENRYIQLVVEQQGIDVIVRVFSPTSKTLGEFDTPNGAEGPEHVSFVAATAGSYRINVGPLDPNDSTTGRFQIKVLELREATEQEVKASQNQEVVKAKGIALLLEVEGLIPQIRSPLTRIRAQLQAAQLLWESDEKRASRYISDAINGVKEFLAAADVGSQEYFQQFSTITQLRHQIIHILAARDTEAALDFLYSTAQQSHPYGNRRDLMLEESMLELSIVNQVIRNDPARALQLARQNLKSGYSPNLISTLSQLRRRSPELAAELETELARKLLNEQLLKNQDAANVALTLVRFSRPPAARSQAPMIERGNGSYTTLLPENLYNDLLQKMLTDALSYSHPGQVHTPERDTAFNMLNGLHSIGSIVDTIMAGAAAKVEKKLAEFNGSNHFNNVSKEYNTAIAANSVDAALKAIEKAPLEQRDQLYHQLANNEAGTGEIARAKQIINEHISNPQQRRQALLNIEQQEISRALSKGKVEEALRTVAGIRGSRERASQLGQIAGQIGPGQKRAAALNFLERARSLLGPSVPAQDQDQMNALIEIARAFSRYDSKRAFEIIDPLIDQFNELCAAARTLEGFGAEYYEDEELVMQNGNSVGHMAAQLSNVLGTLALRNFEQARTASERIRLPEVRLKVYLDIAQQTIQGSK